MEQSGSMEPVEARCASEIRDGSNPSFTTEQSPTNEETQVAVPLLASLNIPGKKAGSWSVCRCNSPVGQQRVAGGLVMAPPPQILTSAFADLIDLPPLVAVATFGPPRQNDRQDIDMALQRRLMCQREQETKLSRMEQHIQSRQFDRSFAIHALKHLVVESARYQRTFYHPNTGFPTRALVAARSHRPFRKQPKTYMMLSNRETRTLLDDVDLLLDPAQPVDRSENVLHQLVGLSLFTPSAFPLAPR
jgi:hypothetical protein